VDLVALLVWLAILVIVIIAAYAILQKVTLDPAIRNIVTVALIAVVAIIAIIVLLNLTGHRILVP
jgi:hypothetical protein